MTSQDSLARLDDDAATLPLAELHVEVGDRAIRCAMQDVDLAPALGAPPVCDRCGCRYRWHQRLSPGPTASTIAVFPVRRACFPVARRQRRFGWRWMQQRGWSPRGTR